MYNWILENWVRILEKIGEHLFISITALLIGAAIAIPLGILLSKTKRISQVVISIASILQTLPSLALLAIMVPLVGVGRKPAIIALAIYSLLPILRNTYLGMTGVDKDLVDASKGMGMTKLQIIKKVQLPISIPVIMSGLQLSAVYLVAWTTIASYIGAGGLGDLIFMGLNNYNFYAILSGTIPVTVIALLLEWILGVLKNRLTPRTFRDDVIESEF